MENNDTLISYVNTQHIVKKESINSSWAFNIDHVELWSYWNNAFTVEECEKLIEIGENHVQSEGTTRCGNLDKIRDSEIAWLFPSDETEWVYRRLTDIIMNLNDRFFQFDLFGTIEGLQFTKYSAPSGRYGKHIDSSPNSTIRKLSFTLQLSDPKDYEGGDLCLYFGDEPIVMSKKRGDVALFPSYVLHEVKPVTKGTRYSLVSWVTGKPFK